LGYSQSYGSKLMSKEHVASRITELLKRTALRTELTRAAIIDRIREDWDQARKMGQMSAALKAGELIGKELHRMFVDRKEIGLPGDFDNKTEQELRDYIATEMSALGITQEDIKQLAIQQQSQTRPAIEKIIDVIHEPTKELSNISIPLGVTVNGVEHLTNDD